MAKSCRGGFLGSHCQWVALQNQRYGMGMEEQGGRAAQRLHTRVLSISGSAAWAVSTAGLLQPGSTTGGEEASARGSSCCCGAGKEQHGLRGGHKRECELAAEVRINQCPVIDHPKT